MDASCNPVPKSDVFFSALATQTHRGGGKSKAAENAPGQARESSLRRKHLT